MKSSTLPYDLKSMQMVHVLLVKQCHQILFSA